MTHPTEYRITLPLPPSINAAHTRNKKGGVFRSSDYLEWIERAGQFWRAAFPNGTPRLLTGRLRLQLMIVRHNEKACDIGNYEKIIADYFEKKFYENDNQIDENFQYRRIDLSAMQSYIRCWVKEIPDQRYIDFLNQA